MIACRSRIASPLAAVLALAFLAGPVAAQLAPPPLPGWPFHRRERSATEAWRETRLVGGGGMGLPASFPGGWDPGAGWWLGVTVAAAEWCDLAFDFEAFSLRFDDSDLRARGASSVLAGEATFGDIAAGVHLHAPRTGFRPYAVVQLALPDVSRPQVTWSDANGNHAQAGTEIFGFDPGWVLGAGFDRSAPGSVGGSIEARLVFAPGSTRPSEYMLSLRAGVSVPLPF